jgi:hypothetical protein
MSQKTESIPKPIEAEILLDCVEVAGYKIKPWSILKAKLLSPVIEEIIVEFKRRGISLKSFFKLEGVETEIVNIEQVLFAIQPSLPKIIAITLNIKEEELDNIKQADVFNIISVILQQNIEYLKNLFALTIVAMKELKKITN